MSDIDIEDVEKVNDYFCIIDKRIVDPIKKTDIKKSCTATLVLLFAAIDSLGKLSCQDQDYESSSRRFKSFLKRIGRDYENISDALWQMRNSLVHNGVNLESYMSATSEGDFGYEHLKTRGPDGFIYINTTTFFSDFCKAKRTLTEEIYTDKELFKLAANRLEWLPEDPQEYTEEEIFRPTPPASIGFIHL
jgi:hypothetical protein